MRSDRYNTGDPAPAMDEEERMDFRNDNYTEKHAAGPETAKSSGGGCASFIKNLIIDIVIAVLLAAAVLYFVRPTIVKQSSMEDTLHNNDYLIMYRKAYAHHDPERGDIVVFQSTLVDERTGGDKLLIKRVIGLPGDDLMIKDGMLYINGEYYEEDYLKDGYTPAGDIPAEGETFTVPEGMYFVMGDNRVSSIDSRRTEVGCVDEDQIIGRAVLRLFPFSQIRRL